MYDCAQMRRVMPANSNASPGIQVIAGLLTSPRLQKSTRSKGACAITPRCRKNHFPENTQPLSAPMPANSLRSHRGTLYSLDQMQSTREKEKRRNFEPRQRLNPLLAGASTRE